MTVNMSVPPPERRIFCNRTLNLRSLRAIGYDMDYTLVHYRVDEWERLSFEHARTHLNERGHPVDDLAFDPTRMIQGLAFDLELGNLVKATRFGYVIKAHHGTRPLTYGEIRSTYPVGGVDLSSARWEFANTLFSRSQGDLYAQMVDLFDAGRLSDIAGYDELFRVVTAAIDEAHWQGEVKAEILSDPERFVEPDPDLVPALLDQRGAGKTLMLITNSDWSYTREMMGFAVDPVLPDGASWRELFDLVIVSAAKPGFFRDRNPAYRVVDTEAALLAPHRGPFTTGEVYFGGNAALVEESLGLTGNDILYVGDHLFGDVHISKATLRWRTALILRELESEIAASHAFAPDEAALVELMTEKSELERVTAALRLARQRGEGDRPEIDRELTSNLARAAALDERIGPLARAAGELGNAAWGPMMRAGIDKSLFARQVERYADVYTSRVANFGPETPYAYLRAARSSLPHDAADSGLRHA